ncbi:hypothetical protein D0Y60_06655 [Shinella sp. WSJ-2]|nr:hypothetical protein D0Y60_06655 [Shinella sp. WSJ-2]
MSEFIPHQVDEKLFLGMAVFSAHLQGHSCLKFRSPISSAGMKNFTHDISLNRARDAKKINCNNFKALTKLKFLCDAKWLLNR